MSYRYWSVNVEDSECKITLKDMGDLESEIATAKKKLEEVEAERAEAKKNRDNAKEEELTNYRYQYYTKDSEYVQSKAGISKLEEHLKIKRRNKGIEIEVHRLKDTYSRKESVCVILLCNSVEEARINSTPSMINEDIYKLEEYGVYLTSPYYDELANAIRDIYFDLEVTEREFIDNDIPKEAVKAIVKMCNEELKTSGEYYIDKEEKYYNIPVKDFKKWYESSAFRRFSLTSIKEALIIHGYARGNKGRNEHTVANIGKVVSLNKAMIEAVKEDEENE